MNKYILSLCLFILGCSSSLKKEQNISRAKESIDILCFIDDKFLFLEKITVTKINDLGVNIKIEDNGDEFLIKRTCLLEKKNVFKKIDNSFKITNFICVLDNKGDTFIKGDNYSIINSYIESEIVEIYSELSNHSFLVPKERCEFSDKALLDDNKNIN